MTTRTLPAPVPPPHTRVEDTAGLLTGALLASLGVFLIEAAGAVTGGTAGLCLVLGHALPVPFPVLYAAVNLPFVLLGARRKGVRFAVRSVVAVGLVSALTVVHPHALTLTRLSPLYGALLGNLLLGLGILVLFRHQASLGGFNVVALLAQERRGWRAGHVQLVLDALVVASALLVVPVATVLSSAAGAAVLNLVLAMNHRPGRYRA